MEWNSVGALLVDSRGDTIKVVLSLTHILRTPPCFVCFLFSRSPAPDLIRRMYQFGSPFVKYLQRMRQTHKISLWDVEKVVYDADAMKTWIGKWKPHKNPALRTEMANALWQVQDPIIIDYLYQSGIDRAGLKLYANKPRMTNTFWRHRIPTTHCHTGRIHR